MLKYLPSAQGLLKELGVRDDDKIPLDEVSRNDLRVRVPVEQIGDFLSWYDTQKGREISPWREFYEELIAPGIVPAAAFPFAYFDYVKTYVSGIQFSDYFQCHELLIAEIFDLVPTDEQLEILRQLKSKRDERFVWSTEVEIRSRGVVPPRRMTAIISENASWLL